MVNHPDWNLRPLDGLSLLPLHGGCNTDSLKIRSDIVETTLFLEATLIHLAAGFEMVTSSEFCGTFPKLGWKMPSSGAVSIVLTRLIVQ